MKPRTRTFLSFAVLVILLFGLYAFSDWFSRTTGYVLGEDEKLKLARCLEEKNAVFYTSSTCPECDKQLGDFGEDAADFLNIFECESAESCPAEGGVPAWRINNEFYYGVKDLVDLVELSNCGQNLES